MGVTMSFTRMSAEELEGMAGDSEWAEEFIATYERPAGDPDGYLDKAWAGLAFLLLQANVGVDLFETGTSCGLDGYFAWSPDDVAATARTLGKIPFEELALFYDPETMDGMGLYPRIWVRDGSNALAYLRNHYYGLDQVFRHAHEHGSGLLQHFG